MHASEAPQPSPSTSPVPPLESPTGGALTPEQRAKLQSELDVVQSNMNVLGEMLSEVKPGQEERDELELLQVWGDTLATLLHFVTFDKESKTANCSVNSTTTCTGAARCMSKHATQTGGTDKSDNEWRTNWGTFKD